MSLLNLKWVQGAPAELLPGMVVRVHGQIVLIGSWTPTSVAKVMLADCKEYSQAIQSYELDWLENMGVPAKVIA
jgi:hypothetical protein